MEFFKKHVDTIVVLGGIVGALIWMNGKFNKLETELAVMKTILIMKEIYPKELATSKAKAIECQKEYHE